VNVHVLSGGPILTNAYLLTELKSGEAILIDAPEGTWEQVEPILQMDHCRLAAVWLTHGHWDHTQGAAEVVRKTGVPVYAHRDDQPLIETPEVMRPLILPGLVIEPVKVDHWLEDGAAIQALGERVGISHVPGHSAGSIQFHFPGAGAVFAGDVLFQGNVGRTDLPGGSAATLEASIRSRLYTLPDTTTVFPGHGGPTTIGDEKENNPYVRG
jgi:hydroxyacylglutathione hydrolase